VDTATARLSFQIENELIVPVRVERFADTTKSFFVFSMDAAARFVEAMSSERDITFRWTHEDGHSDERAINGTGFSAQEEIFGACKKRFER
jgi:hypothetical protein